MQFTQLTSFSKPDFHSSLKVLTVDEKGKVILVENKNFDEKISSLENEIAILKKQVSNLLAFFSTAEKIN